MKIIKVWAKFQTNLKYHDHYLSEVMQEQGIETFFLSSDKAVKEWLPFMENKVILAGNDEYKGSKILRLKSKEFMGKVFITDIKSLYKIINKTDFDIIHFFGLGNPITFLILLLLVFKKKSPLVVANDHTNPTDTKNGLIASTYHKTNRFLFLILGGNIKRIYVPNIGSKNLIQNRYNISSDNLIKIIPLGYDASIFKYKKDNKNTENKLVIGFAGKIIKEKRIEILINAVHCFPKNSIKCIIVGINKDSLTDYQENIIALAESKDRDIEFKPFISDNEMLANFYNYIDIAIYPGSISITTIEANGCGTPIILYKSIDGLEDRVEENRGILFETKEELLIGIKYYLNAKEKSNINFNQIAKNTCKHSWKEISKAYINDYNFFLK